MKFDYSMKCDELNNYKRLAKSRQRVINNIIKHAEMFKKDKDIVHIHKILGYKRDKNKIED